MKLIDKDALVAEIKKRRDAALTRKKNLEAVGQVTVLDEMIAFELNRIISYLDTIEVKIMNGEKVPMATMNEEPVSEDPWEASKQYALRQVLASTDTEMSEQEYLSLRFFNGFELAVAHKDGINWKTEQFEKERLKHCEALTEEQAQIESDFVAKHLKKNSRTPTFIDAIEYGMRLQKEQLMAKAIDGLYIRRNRHTKKNVVSEINRTHDVFQKFKDGDKVKVLVVKED